MIQETSMSSALKIVSRKVIFRGVEQEVSEDHFEWLEKKLRKTGEPLEDAIERLYIEEWEGNADKPKQTKKPNSSTLDYYLLKR